MTEVIEVGDLDLGLGQALAFIGAPPARQRGLTYLHPSCVQKVHGHGACVRRELRRPSGRTFQTASSAS